MRRYIEEDQKMRADYRERDRERQAAEEQRIAAFAREQVQRDEERRAVQSAQNEYRERMQREVILHHHCHCVMILCYTYLLLLLLLLLLPGASIPPNSQGGAISPKLPP